MFWTSWEAGNLGRDRQRQGQTHDSRAIKSFLSMIAPGLVPCQHSIFRILEPKGCQQWHDPVIGQLHYGRKGRETRQFLSLLSWCGSSPVSFDLNVSITTTTTKEKLKFFPKSLHLSSPIFLPKLNLSHFWSHPRPVTDYCGVWTGSPTTLEAVCQLCLGHYKREGSHPHPQKFCFC